MKIKAGMVGGKAAKYVLGASLLVLGGLMAYSPLNWQVALTYLVAQSLGLVVMLDFGKGPFCHRGEWQSNLSVMAITMPMYASVFVGLWLDNPLMGAAGADAFMASLLLAMFQPKTA